jgi:Leucine-rich repeat (LRR) protein
MPGTKRRGLIHQEGNLQTKKASIPEPASSPLLRLPKELWVIIASKLNLKELKQLKLASSFFNRIGKDYEVFKSFYARLRHIDTSVPAELPKHNYIAVIKGAVNKIYQRQKQEMDYLKKNHKLPENIFKITDERSTLDPVEILEQRSQWLDEVNIDIIKPYIDIDIIKPYIILVELSLFKKYITRIPRQLLDVPEYANYWKNLTKIDVSYNFIRTLPQNIDRCQALEELDCSNNELTGLPDSLGNCQGLQMLKCANNQLTAFPNSLGNCPALQILDCVNNQLTALPGMLGNCQVLQLLFCNHNQLTGLPDTLGSCQVLNALECFDNHIKTLPPNLISKFGQTWANETLSNQQCEKTHGTLPPAQPATHLPAYRQVTTQMGKRNISQREVDEVTKEAKGFTKNIDPKQKRRRIIRSATS